MKVALYARVSKADQSQDPENQLMRLREYAATREWEVYGEPYVDYASGADSYRPALDRMLSDARARRFDLILVVKIDRIARSARNLLNIIEDLNSRGVKLECADQDIYTNTPVGRHLITSLGAVAELERDLISERTKAGLLRAVARGKRLGRRKVPFDADYARTLRAQGMGYRAIAKLMGVSHQTVKNRLRFGVSNAPSENDGPEGA